MIMFHPAFGVIFPIILLGVMMVTFAEMFDEGEDYQVYEDEITVLESEITFGETDSGPTVAVIGTLTNASPVPWRDIYFHVEFFDVEGELTDVGQKQKYSFYLPANDSVSFKISLKQEFPEAHYAGHTIRVLSAKDAKARW